MPTSLPSNIKNVVISRLLQNAVLAHIEKNFIQISQEQLERLRQSLKQNYFLREAPGYLDSEAGREDLKAHLTERVEWDRLLVIPWLASEQSLDGCRVLEIGCGTGSSTIALAEQGAEVTAIDVDGPALKDAEVRLELYGLKARLEQMNAVEVADHFRSREFDYIIYWSTLEHLTLKERLATMRQTWNMLARGALWSIIGTPNRLHFYDSHTAFLPFFLWLPDELAVQYARYSERAKYRDAMAKTDLTRKQDSEAFARWGRGMSFHEFELAMAPVGALKVRSSLRQHLKGQSILWRAGALISANDRYARFLQNRKPNAHVGFFDPYLDLIIEKD